MTYSTRNCELVWTQAQHPVHHCCYQFSLVDEILVTLLVTAEFDLKEFAD